MIGINKMNNKWRQFLKENWFKEEDEAFPEEEINVSFKFLNSIFKIFHISENFLSKDQFVFQPRIPGSPYQDGLYNIEDDFTKRISLGPTIEKCLEALGGDLGGFLYAADLRAISDDDESVVNLSKEYFPVCVKNLSTKGNKYGPKYKLAQFLDDEGLSSEEWENIKEKYMKGCVPDSKNTKEMWALHPITLYFIGEVFTDSTKVLLSKACLELFDFISHKYPEQYGQTFLPYLKDFSPQDKKK